MDLPDLPVGQMIQQESGRYEMLMGDFPRGEYLESEGWQGGGYSWEAIAEVLLKLKADEATQKAISFDCEGSMFVAQSDTQAPLIALSKLIAEAEADEGLLKKAIALAEADGSME
jgi:Immunity protein 51